MVNGYLILKKDKVDFKYSVRKIIGIMKIVILWMTIYFLVEKVVFKNNDINLFIAIIKCLVQKGYFTIFWFFGSLIIIYIILPFLHKIFNKSPIKITLLFILIMSIFDIASLLGNSIFSYGIVQRYFIQTFRLWTWIGYFFLGGLFSNKESLKKINKIKFINLKFLILSLLTSILYEYYIANNVYNNLLAEHFYDNILVLSFVFSLFYILIFKKINFNEGIFYYLSKYSSLTLGIYVMHYISIKIIREFYIFDSFYYNMILLFIIFNTCAIITKLLLSNKITKHLVSY